MNIQTIVAAALGCIGAFHASSVLADDKKPDRPTVTKAFDVFETYPSKIPPGTVVAFQKRNTAVAARIVQNGIQARVFAVEDYAKQPAPIATKDDCNIYLSYVFPLSLTAKGDLLLDTFDERWLNPTSSELNIKDGRYYIVFERVGPTQEQFGIIQADVDAYFDSGFLLVVSNDGSASKEKVLAEYARRKAKLTDLRAALDNPQRKVPCYRYAKYASQNEERDEEPEMLASCEAEQKLQ